MYASIRRYRTDPKSVAEITRLVQQEFVPLISAVPGFVSYYILDQGDGTLASTSVFQHKQAAQESNKVAADWVKKRLGSLLPNPPEITVGEVVVEHRVVQRGR